MNDVTNNNYDTTPLFISDDNGIGDNVVKSNILFKYQQNECIICDSTNYESISSNSDLKLCYNSENKCMEYGNGSNGLTKIYFDKRKLNTTWNNWWDWYGDSNLQYWKDREMVDIISDGSSFTSDTVSWNIKLTESHYTYYLNNCIEFNFNVPVANCSKILFELSNNYDVSWFLVYLTRVNIGNKTIERSEMTFPTKTGKETKVLIYNKDIVNNEGQTVEQWLETLDTSESEKYYIISASM
jgi:hypothetical protein